MAPSPITRLSYKTAKVTQTRDAVPTELSESEDFWILSKSLPSMAARIRKKFDGPSSLVDWDKLLISDSMLSAKMAPLYIVECLKFVSFDSSRCLTPKLRGGQG
jgi:hypothetical protein